MKFIAKLTGCLGILILSVTASYSGASYGESSDDAIDVILPKMKKNEYYGNECYNVSMTGYYSPGDAELCQRGYVPKTQVRKPGEHVQIRRDPKALCYAGIVMDGQMIWVRPIFNQEYCEDSFSMARPEEPYFEDFASLKKALLKYTKGDRSGASQSQPTQQSSSDSKVDAADSNSQRDLANEAFAIVGGFYSNGPYTISELRRLIDQGLRASEARDGNGNSLISALLERAVSCDPDPIQFLLQQGVPTDPREHIGSTSVDKALLLANKKAKTWVRCSNEVYMKWMSDCNREVTLLMQAGSQFTGGDQLVKTCDDEGYGTKTTTTSYLNPGMISTSSSSSSSYSTPTGPKCTVYTVPGSPGITVCN
jgi:hypothetical protein